MPYLAQRTFRWQHHNLSSHDFADKKNFQRIYGIFAAEVEAAASDFLGQDRPLQSENGETVRDDAANQQGQKDVCVVGQLKGKDDACEWRAHCAAENGSHADEWPEA